MRKLHPFYTVLLAALFAGQAVAGVAERCESLQTVEQQHACCDAPEQRSAPACGCYDSSDQPANPEPVVQAQPTAVVATLTPVPDATPDPAPRRLTKVETLHLPAPPPLRARDVRAPPVLW